MNHAEKGLKMKIASITDPFTANGLKLAGLEETREIENLEEGKENFEEMMGRKDLGVIIITEELAQKMEEEILEARNAEERSTPIIIEIPSREGPIPERREMIDKLVKRAVGIKVES